MNINISLFGQLKEIAGSQTIAMDNVSDINDLQNQLQINYPALSNAKYVIAVDKTIVRDNIKLSAKNEIALLPPFSGG